MKIKIALSLLALSAIPCQAGPKHFYKSWKWWAGETGGIVLPVALDAQSTCQAFAHGAVEIGPAFKGNRSCGTEVAAAGAAIGLYTVLHWGLWEVTHNNRHKAIRVLGEWAIPITASAIHFPAAAHNYEVIEPRMTPAAICTDPDRDCERKPDKD